MPGRPSWDGFLRFNLIAVPVKAYSAAASASGKIAFHMVHKKCNSRIRYQKVCPIHGEVDKDDIVTAYEFAKGKYVTVEPDELEKLRSENDKAINIDAFIHADALDPVYYSGRTYYLVPEGRVAQKPYAVLQEVMASRQRFGIAQVVFSGREQLAVVRPVDGLLVMSLLTYADQIKKPTGFAEEAAHPELAAEERKLAETLIDASTTDRFDIEKYEDEYAAKLTKLIEAKTKGKKITTAHHHEEPAVINLMDALRQSLHQAQKSGGAGRVHHRSGAVAKKPARRRKPARHPAKRKTG